MANQVLIPRQEIPEELNLLPKENLDPGLWQSLKSNIHDTFFPEKLPPLELTSRPVRVREIGRLRQSQSGWMGCRWWFTARQLPA